MMFKRFSVLCVVIAAMLLTALPVSAEGVAFTKQPKGGEVDLGQTFTFTFETNVPCDCMLQMRADEAEDWGNVEFVTSPHTLVDFTFPYSSQYRLAVDYNDQTYYSNVFTVAWKEADNATTAQIQDVEWSKDLPLGYEAQSFVPLKVTNTGSFTLENPVLKLPEGSCLELAENESVSAIKPGAVNSTGWSVRPKTGLGVGSYIESVFLYADNLKEIASCAVKFFVVESDVEVTYSLAADPIDFGTVQEPVDLTKTYDLTIRATGTGNLTNVHLKLENADQSFFKMNANNLSLNLNAGTDSGANWYFTLRDGVQPGEYDTQIEVYANELSAPVLVRISAVVLAEDASSEPDDAGVVAGEPTDTDGDSDGDADASAQPPVSIDTTAEQGGFPWLAVVIPAVVVIAGACVAVILIRRKKGIKE